MYLQESQGFMKWRLEDLKDVVDGALFPDKEAGLHSFSEGQKDIEIPDSF